MDISNNENASDLDGKYLTFKTDNQLFAIEVADVVQIVGLQTITTMPDSPAYEKGIINLRGSIIPVIDFSLRLGRTEKEYNDRTCIIVLNINGQEIGLIVDEVDSVIKIEIEKISDPPNKSEVKKDNYITGIAKLDKKIVLIMDASKILTEY